MLAPRQVAFREPPTMCLRINLPGETGREVPFFAFLPILSASE